jgi:phage/plasmid-associated DNA primase
MSGLEIYSAITTTIAILETCKKIYDTAHNAKGLPDAFAKVAENIPIVRTVLVNIQHGLEARSQAIKHPRDTVNKQELEDAISSVQPIVSTCRENAEDLQIIFEKVTSADDASWLKRYKAAIRTLKCGRQEKVESLMKEILEKLDLLHKEDYFQNAVQSVDLKAAIKLLEEADASLPEQSEMNFNNYGSGPQNTNTGTGTQNNNTMSGPNSTQTNNYGRSR